MGSSKWMDKDDVYELIEVLLRIIPLPDEESQVRSESQNTDWNEYIDERRAMYRYKMKQLH